MVSRFVVNYLENLSDLMDVDVIIPLARSVLDTYHDGRTVEYETYLRLISIGYVYLFS